MKHTILLFTFCCLLFTKEVKAQLHDFSSYSSEFYVGYSLTNFLNPTFFRSRNNGDINYGDANIELGMRFTNRFMQFNLSVIQNEYKVKNGSSVLTQNNVRFGGFEAGLSLFMLPQASKYFSPYLGIAYLGGSLDVVKPKGTTNSTSSSSQSNTNSMPNLPSARISSPLWKFGMMAAYKKVSLSIEYRQSFATPDRAFHQASLTLGYHFIRED